MRCGCVDERGRCRPWVELVAISAFVDLPKVPVDLPKSVRAHPHKVRDQTAISAVGHQQALQPLAISHLTGAIGHEPPSFSEEQPAIFSRLICVPSFIVDVYTPSCTNQL